jgi:hypothetical protein
MTATRIPLDRIKRDSGCGKKTSFLSVFNYFEKTFFSLLYLFLDSI